ncbi:uL15 family ribosomal protein [Patescibacteria group bacterium]|nr:uL15 family ribosomal protein [Patescibacteria group bacterium]
MQLHDLRIKKSKKKKRVGRGGKRGTYSGRGNKGQKSRAGRKMRPELRDFIKKIPKKRGYKFKAGPKPQIVNLKDLEKNFKDGDLISPKTLFNKGLIGKLDKKGVKILGDGKISKKFEIKDCLLSKSVAKALGIEIKQKPVKKRKGKKHVKEKQEVKKVEKKEVKKSVEKKKIVKK